MLLMMSNAQVHSSISIMMMLTDMLIELQDKDDFVQDLGFW